MKQFFIFSFSVLMSGLFFPSCQSNNQNQFGVPVDTTVVVSAAQLVNAAPEKNIVVKGNISAVCQGEGCWLKLDAGNGQQLYIDWDKKFTVPRDIEGRVAFAHGFSYADTISVDKLKQQERDKGTPLEEIMNIDSPLVKIYFTADGLIIR
jgi:hypothetical protein